MRNGRPGGVGWLGEGMYFIRMVEPLLMRLAGIWLLGNLVCVILG